MTLVLIFKNGGNTSTHQRKFSCEVKEAIRRINDGLL